MITTDLKTLHETSTDASEEEVNEILPLLEKDLEKDKIAQKASGVGLSAIQIGIPKRIAIVRTETNKINLINPKFINGYDEKWSEEGCLSLPKTWCTVKRFNTVCIENNGKEETYDGFDAIVVQHEMDHMDGILITDKEQLSREPIKAEKKQGRNDPCECGSGKKFKKCCGRN